MKNKLLIILSFLFVCLQTSNAREVNIIPGGEGEAPPQENPTVNLRSDCIA